MPAGGSCLLGSINLAEFVENPFQPNATINFNELEKTVETAVVGLNEVLHEGLELHPLEEQRKSVNNWRQVGLGIFGWHDMLIKLGIKYGDNVSVALADNIGRKIAIKSLETSANLTDVYGTYPKFNIEAILKSKFFKQFFKQNITKGKYGNDDLTTIEYDNIDLLNLIKNKGLANSQLLTIAPTGSLGTMLGISTGIEPMFNLSYTRKTESLHGEDMFYKVYTPIVKEYMQLHNNNIKDEAELPSYFNCAMNLNPKNRINMQSAWQKHIDASISSTVNLPNSATIEEVEELYLYAWKKGLKGVTIFRDGCKRVGILTNDAKADNKKDGNERQSENIKQITQNNKTNEQSLQWGTTLDCADDLIGRKTKIVNGCGTLHLQAWFDPIDGRCMEIYLSKGSTGGCFGYMNALSRLTSAALRTGISFEYVIDQLNSIPACASYVVRTATKHDTNKGSSCPSAIGIALKQMQKDVLDELNCSEDEDKKDEITHVIQKINIETKKEITQPKCPECGEDIIYEGGCIQCKSCGFSKCD